MPCPAKQDHVEGVSRKCLLLSACNNKQHKALADHKVIAICVKVPKLIQQALMVQVGGLQMHACIIMGKKMYFTHCQASCFASSPKCAVLQTLLTRAACRGRLAAWIPHGAWSLAATCGTSSTLVCTTSL